MTFEATSVVWAIPIVAVVLSLVHTLNLVRRQRAIESLGRSSTIALMANSLSTRIRKLRALLSIAALVLCVSALARPTSPGEARWRQRGIDVVFVEQFSETMLAQDVYPSRLSRSLKEVTSLMDGLQADRVGTVVYAGGAAHFPLTQDHLAAQQLYRGLAPSDLAPGADLGQALRLASCMLRGELAEPSLCALLAPKTGGAPLRGSPKKLLAERPLVSERARAMVLFSDGLDSSGMAMEEVSLAKELGITLFVVGVGTRSGELIPLLDSAGERRGWAKTSTGEFRRAQLHDKILRDMAKRGGGTYFSLGEGRWRGQELLAALRELGRGDLDARVIRTRTHIFDRFLFPAFLLLIIEACLSMRRRVVPLPLPGRWAR